MVKNDLVLKPPKLRKWDLRIRFTKVNYETDGKNIFRGVMLLEASGFFVAMVTMLTMVAMGAMGVTPGRGCLCGLATLREKKIMEGWNVGGLD